MFEFKNNDTLFDDVAALEAIMGKGAMNAFSVNANCDCTSYTSPDDDDERDTKIGPRAIDECNR